MTQETFYLITALCSVIITAAIVSKMLPRRIFRLGRGTDRRLDSLDSDIMNLSNKIEKLQDRVYAITAKRDK